MGTRIRPGRTSSTRSSPVSTGTSRSSVSRQRVADYVEYLHSTSSLAREWMTAEESAAFDRAATEIVAPHAADGWLEMTVVAEVTWGTVRAG
jgi:hypothetical protein